MTQFGQIDRCQGNHLGVRPDPHQGPFGDRELGLDIAEAIAFGNNDLAVPDRPDRQTGHVPGRHCLGDPHPRHGNFDHETLLGYLGFDGPVHYVIGVLRAAPPQRGRCFDATR